MPKIKLCECGCGNPAPIATFNRAKTGHVKGKPLRFIRGHVGGINSKNSRLKRLVRGKKECTRCRETKILSDFKSRSNGRYDSWCRTCNSEAQKERYRDNPEPFKRRAGESRRESRKIIKRRLQRLRKRGCTLCPESHPSCLDFHHILEKDTHLGRTSSVPEFERELQKCILVCANCHRKIHAGVIIVSPKDCLEPDACRYPFGKNH